ncbi:MAG TPA: GGDEF domain-containing protein [Treponemataceae bacterium]|mgnify:CR=1 FL=1|nr:GGDEF domain-containing protein [Treponemataceae bacterium]
MKTINAIRAGILVSDQESDYSSDLLSGICEKCAAHNIDVIVFPAREKNYPFRNCEYQHYFLRQLISKESCDFLIVASGTQCHYVEQDEFFQSLQQIKVPVISVALPVPSIPSIVVDNDHAIYTLLEHLYTIHNRRKFAFVTVDVESPESEERYNAYCSFLRSKSLDPLNFPVFYGNYSYESGYSIIKAIKKTSDITFDTLIVSNDDMAYGCIDHLKALGVKIPEDVIVTGYDDSKRSIYNHPTLTTINQQLMDQGKKAVAIGLQLMNNETVPSITSISSQARFRQTCGCISHTDTSTNAYLENGEKILFQKDNALSSELFRRREETIMLRFFFNNVSSDITLENLLESLRSHLSNMDISAAAVCLFDEPYIVTITDSFTLPKSIKLVLAYDNKTDMLIQGKEIYFDPREEFLPHGLFRSGYGRLTTAPLYHGERLLGYFIYRPGSYDVLIYEIFCTALSLSISTALEFSKKELEKVGLAEISKTDDLTGLYNRRGFTQISKQSINLALDMGKTGFVIYGDMDGLKKINDTYGHETGDRAIQAIASILKASFRNTDICGRLGGDEFAITAVNISHSVYEKNLKKIAQECAFWSKSQSQPIELSISLGYAEFSHENADFEELLNLADKALYNEKRKKLNL